MNLEEISGLVYDALFGEPEKDKLSILGLAGAIFRSLFESLPSFVIEFLLVTACRS